ncbi:MAG: hypothetical protein COB53_01905 [Elusimicrobia bacterium]|nr:MAG: hypothetical protein COB53_01905 [Elusimicrobiota bacterium]
MRMISILFTILLVVSPIQASTLAGYAVKTDGSTVYLDLGAKSELKTGDHYDLAVVSGELTHPVTGESLGADVKSVGAVRIVTVEEKYSTVEWVQSGSHALKVGDKIKLRSTAGPAPASAPEPAADGLRNSIARSPMLGIEAIGISVGDTDGDGAPEVVLAGSRIIDVYDSNWKRICRYEHKSTASHFMAVESEDVDGDGSAEIFAVAENKFFKRIETLVLDCKAGEITKRKSLPFMVHSFHDGSGLPVLGMQKVDIDGEFMGSSIHRLGYEKGKYGKTGNRIKHKRLDWLYGFGFALQDDTPILLTYSRTNRVRIFFKKGSWSTPGKFGQTAERIAIRDRELKFHPRLIIDTGEAGFRGIYSLSNKARFFQLAAKFGQFNRSELHYQKWNGLALEPVWKGELTGYAADVAERSDSLLVAVVGASGRSSVWTYQK